MRGFNGFTKGVAALVLVVAASVAGAAGASAAPVKPPPPSGLLLCDVTTATLKSSPPLTNTPSARPVRLTFAGSATCDSTGVVGGTVPITDAAFKFTWVAAAGSTCSSLPPVSATKVQPFQLKLQALNARNKLYTVARVNGTQEAVATFYNGFTNRGTARDGETRAFANEEVILNSYVDPDALAEQCAGTGVTTLPFVGPMYVRVR